MLDFLNGMHQFCAISAILLVGHADRSEGHRQHTDTLAEKRTHYVQSLLLRHGAPPEVIETSSKGAGMPIAPRDKASLNRRVEGDAIVVHKQHPMLERPTDCTQYPMTPSGFRIDPIR